jgi:NAD(P)-dependent dehydrogenase (short-subunit alcohol dehydrogenase family)
MTNSAAAPLAGRVALITGANTGIGLTTAIGLAQQGAQVFVACRSSDKALLAVEEIQRASGNSRVAALSVDLGDLASIRACADAFLRQDLPLHLLINNAGLAGARGLTKSGFELAFGVNHIGHFLLTSLLLDRTKRSAPARIVTVSSKSHYSVSGIDWDAVRQRTKTRTALHEYGVSKLANVLFSAELARRLEGAGVTTYSLHPGVVASDVWRSVPWPFRSLMKLGMISTEKGASTSLYCATSAEAGAQTGLYYDECRAKEASKTGQDRALAADLWQRSEEWVR